jgi:hypothetical protein
MKFNLAYCAIAIYALASCSDETSQNQNLPAARSFESLTFNTKYPFFATDGSMNFPQDSAKIQDKLAKIDITFIYSSDFSEPGFMDPKARSQDWTWNDYKLPWLSGSVETRFYSTTLTRAQFDSAKADERLINIYFSDTNKIKTAPHGIFPTGSCIGGRQSTDPESLLLHRGLVFGFRNMGNLKRGFLLIRTDQQNAWPTAIVSTNTLVDIIREH